MIASLRSTSTGVSSFRHSSPALVHTLARPAMRRSTRAGNASNAASVVTGAELNGASSAPSTSATDKENFTGAMLEPSAANKYWVRAAVVAAAVALAAGSVNVLSAKAAAFTHLTAYAIWMGTNVWNSFFVGITMFKNMPRQMFGRVQSKLFPLYFGLTTGCNVLILGMMAIASGGALTQPVINLAVAAALSCVNWLALEPYVTGLMFARYDIENKDAKTEADEAEIKRLYKQFGKWHGISSVLNLAVFACAAAHGWHLAASLAI